MTVEQIITNLGRMVADTGEEEPRGKRRQAANGTSTTPEQKLKDKQPDPAPLAFRSAGAWRGVPVPERRWLVPGRIPAGKVTLLNGDGAAGKTTIALQLCAATVLGSDWLGSVVDTPGPAMFFSAEEDDEEIHRRIDAIVQHRTLDYAALDDLHVYCVPPEESDALLGAPDGNGIIRSTPRMKRLETSVLAIKPALVVIEAAADVYGGNESDRSQVGQFVGLLRKLAIKSGAAIVLLQHPSLTGMARGDGMSGSTHWNNAVRSRLYFTGIKTDSSDEPDNDMRELKVMKANYAAKGEAVRVRWKKGVFVPEGSVGSLERVAAEAVIDNVFLQCLDARTAQKITVSHKGSTNFAPKNFEGMPEAKGYRRTALAAAMERLLHVHRIEVETTGPPSRKRYALVRVPIANVVV